MIKRFDNFEFNEDWEEEEPESRIKIGDKILILPKLEEYVKNNGWSVEMLNLIGKNCIVKGGVWLQRVQYYIIHDDYTWHIPYDCVKKI